ncbi:MAG: hypothetical protein ABWY06_14205 [Pseudomonas sp.]|uniref:hypothetical protein n=1 Tax=Pseudomonas sp. TaxID=306 RepID=UPI00339A4943
MFGFGKDNGVVEVRFFEEQGDAPFAVSTVPVERLPDTFAVDTVLHLNNEDWLVLGADPFEKRQFKLSGKLSLYLARRTVTQMDPQELLYSLPTLNNEIATVEHADSLEGVAVLHEDDWRQCEFLEQVNESLIHEELAGVHSVCEEQRVGSAFKTMHLRQKIVSPLARATIGLAVLEESFAVSRRFSGVAFNNAAVTIVGGFALQTTSGWLLWGQINQQGHITALNLARTQASDVDAIAEDIDNFTRRYALYLVDWPRLFWCGPSKLNFAAYGEQVSD